MAGVLWSARPQLRNRCRSPRFPSSQLIRKPAKWVAVASRYFLWVGGAVGHGGRGRGGNTGQRERRLWTAGADPLRQGPAPEVLKKTADDKFEGKDGRQIAIVDAKGNIAAHTGVNAPKWAGDWQGKTWAAQGNILVGAQVPEAMGKAFDATQGELAEKLFAALKAGDAVGGDARGRQSASMLVVKKLGGRNINNDRYVYINVDDSPAPIPELGVPVLEPGLQLRRQIQGAGRGNLKAAPRH
jgi:uncharacterized Ntn-hydrolase superfamily protein